MKKETQNSNKFGNTWRGDLLVCHVIWEDFSLSAQNQHSLSGQAVLGDRLC